MQLPKLTFKNLLTSQRTKDCFEIVPLQNSELTQRCCILKTSRTYLIEKVNICHWSITSISSTIQATSTLWWKRSKNHDTYWNHWYCHRLSLDNSLLPLFLITMVFAPDYAIHPGVSLEEAMQDRNLTPHALAVMSWISEKEIVSIVKGKSSITPAIADALWKSLWIEPYIRINLQEFYEETLARIASQKRINNIASSVA